MNNENCYDLLERCREYYLNFKPEDLSVCLKNIFEILIKNAKIVDEWTFTWSSTSNCVELHAVSKKQNHEYTIGLFLGEIYIKSDILEPQCIKYVPSEFWMIFSSLDLMKNFKFHDNACLPDGISVDIKTGVSSTYRIIRNFILLEEHEPDSTRDLGWVEIHWALSESVEDIEKSCVDAIKKIHRLNYLLYRVKCQKQRGNKSLTNASRGTANA
ncbi:hypothetical protein ACPDME_003729 [Vibrio cholerae]